MDRATHCEDQIDDDLAPPQQPDGNERYRDPVQSVLWTMIAEVLVATIVWWLVTFFVTSVQTLASLCWFGYVGRSVFKHMRFIVKVPKSYTSVPLSIIKLSFHIYNVQFGVVQLFSDRRHRHDFLVEAPFQIVFLPLSQPTLEALKLFDAGVNVS